MRERFQLHQHGGSSVQASFLKLLGFKFFSRYNMSWLFARVSVLRSFVMLWDCFCIFLLCPWRTNMSCSRHTFDSKTNISSTSIFRKRIAAFSEKELQHFRMRIKCNTPRIRIQLHRNALP